jgi:endonuclease/exonuclease/phosphatase family metal-dependent hydrolase
MTTFKVMTWNLENLFRPEGNESVTQEKYQKKLNSLSEMILALNPDVLAIQESGGPEPVEDLMATLQGNYPHYQLSSYPDKRGTRVGFISRFVIEDSAEMVTFPERALPQVPSVDAQGNLNQSVRFSRGVLQIRVTPQAGFPVYLIVAHLKSKLLSFPSATGNSRFVPKDEDERARVAGVALLQRTAEAVALRTWINDLLSSEPDAALILLGDLNDVAEAATTQLLQGPPGSEISAQASQNRGFNTPDQGDQARLFNLAPLLPEGRQFSRVFKGKGELIDHILASEEMFPGQPRRLPIADSNIELLGGLPSISESPAERREKPGSDHAPITAVFEL